MKIPSPQPSPRRGEGDEWLPPAGHERRRRLLSENTPEAAGAPDYQPRPFQGSEPNKESTTMPSSQKRIDANRANSRRSTGPRSESGKCRSSQNAIRHGLRTVKTTVLSCESIEEYADRMIFVNQDLNPRNRTEALIVSTAVQASWVHDRALRVQTARLNRNIADADAPRGRDGLRTWQTAVFQSDRALGNLGHRQVRLDHGAHIVLGSARAPGRPGYAGPSASVNPRRLPLDAGAVCRAAALLLPGKAWEALDKFKAIRLLGRQPLDIWDRDVCEIHLRTWTIRGMRDNAWSELRSELRKDEYGFIQNTAVRRWPELHDSLDKQKERQALIALIDRAVEQVKAKLAVAEERAERDAALRADCLSFDDSHEGELIRRYETSSRRAFLRSLSEFYKARREADQQEEPYPDDTTEETDALDPIDPTATIATTCEPEMECDDDLGTAVLPGEPTDLEPAGMPGEIGASDPGVLPSEAIDVDRGVLPSEAMDVDRGVLPSEAMDVDRGVLPSEAMDVDRGVLPSEASAKDRTTGSPRHPWRTRPAALVRNGAGRVGDSVSLGRVCLDRRGSSPPVRSFGGRSGKAGLRSAVGRL